jgi:hypothetical protein
MGKLILDAMMNLVWMRALTCFLSPRRGQRGGWFLAGGRLTGKSSRANFQADGGGFPLYANGSWGRAGARWRVNHLNSECRRDSDLRFFAMCSSKFSGTVEVTIEIFSS